MKKTQLTQSDLECLDAARGLDLYGSIGNHRLYANKLGLRPSVTDYNRAIKMELYTGRPIEPLSIL